MKQGDACSNPDCKKGYDACTDMVLRRKNPRACCTECANTDTHNVLADDASISTSGQRERGDIWKARAEQAWEERDDLLNEVRGLREEQPMSGWDYELIKQRNEALARAEAAEAEVKRLRDVLDEYCTAGCCQHAEDNEKQLHDNLRAAVDPACPTSGCDGDPRYAAPGRGHIDACLYPSNLPDSTEAGR